MSNSLILEMQAIADKTTLITPYGQCSNMERVIVAEAIDHIKDLQQRIYRSIKLINEKDPDTYEILCILDPKEN